MESWNILNTCFLSLGKLLTRRERTWASVIYPIVVEEFSEQRRNDVIDLNDINFDFKIEATKNNFEHIIELFKNAQKSRDVFFEHFPVWSFLRKQNVVELGAIADAIHVDKFNSNVSRIAGSAFGAVGGVALAASAVCPFTTPIVVGSAIVCTLSGLAVGGTTMSELVLLKSKIAEAKSILQKDQANFQRMAQWFEHTKELVEAIESILGLDLTQSLFEDLGHIQDDIAAAREFGSSDRVCELLTKIKPIVQAMCAIGKLNSDGVACMAPVGITFFFVVILLHKRNRVLFDSVLLTHRLLFGLFGSFDAGIEVSRVVTSLALKGSTVATETASKMAAHTVARGVFAGIGVGLDIANIVLTSIDVHKGSLSKHGVEIKKASEKLKEEHDFLEKIYSELK